MAIEEITTQDDLLVYEILRHPVLGPEFIKNYDKLDLNTDDEFSLTWYQKEILCDFNPYVSVTTARAVGKTESLKLKIIHYLVFNMYPDEAYILYTVPSKVHLEPVFTGLVREFRSNSLLKQFIRKNGGINSSDHKIELLNSAVLLCRIAGQSGTGANLIGLHTPLIIGDEMGYFPFPAWQEMQPSLNVWTQGFQELVVGVPTGMRENNVLYFADQVNHKFTHHRVSAFDNPRMTEKDIEDAKKQYGGDDTDDYIHYVLGKHGKPVYSLFDRSSFAIESYPVTKLVVNGLDESLTDYDLLHKVSMFPTIDQKHGDIFFGIDLGYTDPTVILILYLDRNNKMKLHGEITLKKVLYPIQEKIIDLLMDKFLPAVVGIDRGNAGISVIQNLISSKEYESKDYSNRIYPIDFSSSTVIGTDEDGRDVKIRTKELAVSILQEYTNSHRLIYSSTFPELSKELERMVYVKGPSGRISYKTLSGDGKKSGDDHRTAALLCGVTAFNLTFESKLRRREKPKFLRAMWV